MFMPSSRQTSFFDVDSLCERLIPEHSFYRKFRETVWPLVKDEQFETMYCKDNGRPPISPALLAMATILQFYRDLSDREMERAAMYDIEIKYALGLSIDARPFDHSSLHDFRKRLLENGKEKRIFDTILQGLIGKGLIEKNDIQRIDATHVIADIAIPTMITLIKKGIFEIIKPLEKKHFDTMTKLAKDIDLSPYSKKEINHEAPGRMDMEKKKKVIVEVVGDARKVLEHVQNIKDSALQKPIEMLRRILRENITDNEETREKTPAEKPHDILVSPVDPDARYGAKSKHKHFMGYKANITETTKSRFITNINAIPGNRPDGEPTVSLITEQKDLGLTPSKLIGDSAYGDGQYRKELKHNGTDMVAPLKMVNDKTKVIYPKSMFQYNEEAKTLTCPAGVTTKQSFYDKKKEVTVYHFPQAVCTRCPQNKQCTTAADGRRTVGIGKANTELREAEQYNKTQEFKNDMKLRQPIEGKLSELVRYHGLRRARYRGLKKVNLQCYFTGAAVNIKRWIKVELEKLKPNVQAVPVG